jgi:hypothetical protein
VPSLDFREFVGYSFTLLCKALRLALAFHASKNQGHSRSQGAAHEALDSLTSKECHQVYKMLRLNTGVKLG